MNREFCDLLPVKKALMDAGWKSPDTYCNCYDWADKFPAVYLFMLHDRETLRHGLVAYVGMSTNLAARWSGHQILRELNGTEYWTMRWFKPTPKKILREVESGLIKEFDPPWNIAGRARGLALS